MFSEQVDESVDGVRVPRQHERTPAEEQRRPQRCDGHNDRNYACVQPDLLSRRYCLEGSDRAHVVRGLESALIGAPYSHSYSQGGRHRPSSRTARRRSMQVSGIDQPPPTSARSLQSACRQIDGQLDDHGPLWEPIAWSGHCRWRLHTRPLEAALQPGPSTVISRRYHRIAKIGGPSLGRQSVLRAVLGP